MDNFQNNQAKSEEQNSEKTSAQESNMALALPPDVTAQDDKAESSIQFLVISQEKHDSRFYNRLGFYCEPC